MRNSLSGSCCWRFKIFSLDFRRETSLPWNIFACVNLQWPIMQRSALMERGTFLKRYRCKTDVSFHVSTIHRVKKSNDISSFLRSSNNEVSMYSWRANRNRQILTFPATFHYTPLFPWNLSQKRGKDLELPFSLSPLSLHLSVSQYIHIKECEREERTKAQLRACSKSESLENLWLSNVSRIKKKWSE